MSASTEAESQSNEERPEATASESASDTSQEQAAADGTVQQGDAGHDSAVDGARKPLGQDQRKKRGAAIGLAAAVTLISAGFTSYAFMPAHAGQARFYIVMAGGYGLLTLVALVWLRRRQKLHTLMPQRGDIFLGSIAAGTLYMLASTVSVGLLPAGTLRHSWLVRIYLHLGDPRVAVPVYVGFAVLMIAAAEELVWRGWVMRALAEGFGNKRAWLISTGLYALAHAGTLHLLRVPGRSFNPLLVIAALGCGLVWGAMATRLERSAPSIFCHAVFSWALIRFPLFG